MRVTPQAIATLAMGSAAAVYTAAWLDPMHDPLADYLSWLSAGPYWWLAGSGILALGVAGAATAWRLNHVLAGRPREATVTFLACMAVLAGASIALPSRGFDEPLWRTSTHVGIAVGAYASIGGAALVVAWVQRRDGLTGPRTAPWAAALVAGIFLLGSAASVIRLIGAGPDLRGLGQLVLLALAAAWLSVAPRLSRAP